MLLRWAGQEMAEVVQKGYARSSKEKLCAGRRRGGWIIFSRRVQQKRAGKRKEVEGNSFHRPACILPAEPQIFASKPERVGVRSAVRWSVRRRLPRCLQRRVPAAAWQKRQRQSASLSSLLSQKSAGRCSAEVQQAVRVFLQPCVLLLSQNAFLQPLFMAYLRRRMRHAAAPLSASCLTG